MSGINRFDRPLEFLASGSQRLDDFKQAKKLIDRAVRVQGLAVQRCDPPEIRLCPRLRRNDQRHLKVRNCDRDVAALGRKILGLDLCDL